MYGSRISLATGGQRGQGRDQSFARWPAFLGLFALFFVAAMPFVITRAMTSPPSHDEDQHIAAGALVARDGLLPYRDFPCLHTPNLALLYGVIFRGTDYLMLAARLVSAISAAAVVGLVATIAWTIFRDRGRIAAWTAAVGTVILCLFSRGFATTTGLAWNQELALLLVLLAGMALWSGVRDGKPGWLLAAGLFAGLAIGTRVTYAPLLAPFGLTVLFGGPLEFRKIVSRVCWFSAGCAVGFLPVIVLWMLAPEAAKFGIFDFAKANIAYRLATGEPRTMTFLKKVRFLFKEVVREDYPLYLAAIVPLSAAMLVLRKRIPPVLCYLLLLAPFVLWGAMAPSPVFDQYFYPLVPLLTLCAVVSLSAIPRESKRLSWIPVFCGLMAVLAIIRGADEYDKMERLKEPEDWTPMKQHEFGREYRRIIDRGRVLTLAPAVAVEGGVPVYPEFATGPFAWRVSNFIDPDKTARIGLVTPQTLPVLLEKSPPAAIVLQAEKGHETQFRDWAEVHRFAPVRVTNGHDIWRPR